MAFVLFLGCKVQPKMSDLKITVVLVSSTLGAVTTDK